MSEQIQSESLAKWTFRITFFAALLYVGVVFLYIITDNGTEEAYELEGAVHHHD